jgi:3-deoxy-D-manno-octulosonic-acid transferase
MSDHSFPGYRRFRFFFGGLLRKFDVICVQTEIDRERFLTVAPDMKDRVQVCGNIKFDQQAPAHLVIPDLSKWFGQGKGPFVIAASTHPEEEVFLAGAWQNVRGEFPESRLIVVPRHAERGGILQNSLSALGLKVYRKSTGGEIPEGVDCLLADTTGELQGFLAASDIVLMGKTFAGNTEGQNIIEPAMLGKAIISGMELKNFRQAQDILVKADSVIRISDSSELESALKKLLSDSAYRSELGLRAKNAIAANHGATAKNLDALKKILPAEQK